MADAPHKRIQPLEELQYPKINPSLNGLHPNMSRIFQHPWNSKVTGMAPLISGNHSHDCHEKQAGRPGNQDVYVEIEPPIWMAAT